MPTSQVFRIAPCAILLLVVAACATAPPPALPQPPPFLRTYAPEGVEAGLAATYPIVVLVPGCLSPAEGAAAPQYERFAKRLANEGYFVGIVAWHGSYPGDPSCAATMVPNSVADEIDRAVSALRQSELVQKDRVHLVGWSRAGSGVIAAIGKARAHEPAYRASTIIYPECPDEIGWTSDTLLQFLLAMRDESAAGNCQVFADKGEGPAPLVLVQFDASHGFDIRPDRDDGFAWLFADAGAYDPSVAEGAYLETLKFIRIGDPRPDVAAPVAASAAGDAAQP